MPTLTLTDIAPGRTATLSKGMYTEGRITGIKPEGDKQAAVFGNLTLSSTLGGSLSTGLCLLRSVSKKVYSQAFSFRWAVRFGRNTNTDTTKNRWKRCLEACNRYPKEAR